MAHETIEPGRTVVYNLPSQFSDALRSMQFAQFFSQYQGPPFSVRTRDGWSWSSSARRVPEFVVTFRSGEVLDAVIGAATEATLGRLFLEGAFDIHGNNFVLLSVAEYTLRHAEGLSTGLVQTVGRISVEVSRRLVRIRRHAGRQNWHVAPCPLDLPVGFFEPWLGPCLGHSCGFFRSKEEDLETAQRNALESTCGRLELDTGDRLLDVGCGWGSFLLYAAQRSGAQARGITWSPLQLETVQDRICGSGLQSKCSVEYRNLRAMPYGAEGFHKIAHLGIFERASSFALGKFFTGMQNMLVPGGLLLLDRMTRARDCGAVVRYMQPGMLSQSLSKELELAEWAGLELLSVENVAAAYEQTLRVWIDRLLANWMSDVGRPFAQGYRAWLLYLVEVAAGLRAEELQVHRILLRRSRRRGNRLAA